MQLLKRSELKALEGKTIYWQTHFRDFSGVAEIIHTDLTKKMPLLTFTLQGEMIEKASVGADDCLSLGGMFNAISYVVLPACRNCSHQKQQHND